MKSISIGSWAYTIGPYAKAPIDFEVVCDKLEELGFNGIELGAFRPHPNPDDYPEKAQREELAASMQERGLGFSGIAANLWGEKLINTEDTADYISEFKKNSDFARDLGIAAVRVDCVQPPTIHREVDYNVALQRVVNTWKTCCEIASDNNQYVTWEFEPGFAFNKPSDIPRIHDGVAKDNFGILYDTCHGQMVGVIGARQEGQKETFPNQIELMRKLHGRINHIHLIDSDNTCHKDANGEDETSAHPPFGRGILNFDEIMPELIKAAKLPHNWWTIDLCFWPDAWAATETCKKFMDGLVAKYSVSGEATNA